MIECLAPPLRGRIGADDPYPQVVPAAGLGCLRRQAAGMKCGTVAVARKLAVIMHRIWVTGDEFDFGGPAVAAKAA